MAAPWPRPRPTTEIVLVHDAVRPFIDPDMIQRVVEAARKSGAAILGIPSVDTVKQVERQTILGTIPRERIVLAQTPQAFRYEIIREAFDRADADGFIGTDEASLVERLGYTVTRRSWAPTAISRSPSPPTCRSPGSTSRRRKNKAKAE